MPYPCCCCKPERDWFDDFDDSPISKCYYLRRYPGGGTFTTRRPDSGDTPSGSIFNFPSYTVSGGATRYESLMRQFKFHEDDFQINYYGTFKNQLSSQLYNRTLRLMNQAFILDYRYFSGTTRTLRFNGQPSIQDNTSVPGGSEPSSVELGMEIKIFGSIAKWSARIYVDATEVTSWIGGFVPGTQYNFSGGGGSTAVYNAYKNNSANHWAEWFCFVSGGGLEDVSLTSQPL